MKSFLVFEMKALELLQLRVGVFFAGSVIQAFRVSGFAFQIPTTVMKHKALPVAILSQRLSVLDSWNNMKFFLVFEMKAYELL